MTEASFTDEERRSIHDAFTHAVNMSPAELRRWLESDDSRSVGMPPDGERVTGAGQHEAVGHHMGQRIVQIRTAKKADLADSDYADMRKVVGYVHRHVAQRPHGDISGTRWRKSLMNWGHDPEKDG